MKFDKKHNCYNAAVRLIGNKNNSAVLVHGYIFSTKLNRLIKHAWVELDGQVWDFAEWRRVILPVEDYYKFGHASAVHRYTREQAQLMAIGTGKTEWWSKKQRKKILG